MKKAFTLAEVLVVLAVLGVLATFMLGSLTKAQPDRNKVMFKKTYSVIERVTNELIIDPSVYPYDSTYYGFKNLTKACIDGTNTCYEGNQYKFCRFFANKLDLSENVATPVGGTCTFKTTDGVAWTIYSKFFEDGDYSVVMIDTNDNNNPNLPAGNHSLAKQYHDLYVESPISAKIKILTGDVIQEEKVSGSKKVIILKDNIKNNKRDRFFAVITYDGKVKVASDSLEAEYLRSQNAN